MDKICPKCGGNMAHGKEGDFYTLVHFLKCFNCGNTISLSPTKLHTGRKYVPLVKIKLSDKLLKSKIWFSTAKPVKH
jgi:hypothetical protein